MTKIRDIPFEQIKLGTIILGNISPGKIVEIGKNPRNKEWDEDGWEITVRWDHSNEESYYVYWMLSDLEVLHEPRM